MKANAKANADHSVNSRFRRWSESTSSTRTWALDMEPPRGSEQDGSRAGPGQAWAHQLRAKGQRAGAGGVDMHNGSRGRHGQRVVAEDDRPWPSEALHEAAGIKGLRPARDGATTVSAPLSCAGRPSTIPERSEWTMVA